MPEPFLARPAIQYQNSYIEAAYEYVEANDDIVWHPEISHASFEEYIAYLESEEINPSGTRVPESIFWLIINGDTYAGELGLRHHLNANLQRFGGHIGYKIRPSQRHKGYGKLICQLGIYEAHQRGINDILITCDDTNIGSQKIIEANGGILHDKVDNKRGVLTRRYWIHGE